MQEISFSKQRHYAAAVPIESSFPPCAGPRKGKNMSDVRHRHALCAALDLTFLRSSQ
jgi:hypothetical protein